MHTDSIGQSSYVFSPPWHHKTETQKLTQLIKVVQPWGVKLGSGCLTLKCHDKWRLCVCTHLTWDLHIATEKKLVSTIRKLNLFCDVRLGKTVRFNALLNLDCEPMEAPGSWNLQTWYICQRSCGQDVAWPSMTRLDSGPHDIWPITMTCPLVACAKGSSGCCLLGKMYRTTYDLYHIPRHSCPLHGNRTWT